MATPKTYAFVWAEFPDDMVDDGEDILVPGGRNVVECLCAAIREMGYETEAFWQKDDYGWEAAFICNGIPIWLLLQGGPERWILIVDRGMSLFAGRARKAGALREGLSVINAAMESEPRIKKVQWMTRDEFDAVVSAFLSGNL